jgi:NADPH:quinone reductase-like Zn-dependent oxidoreductase
VLVRVTAAALNPLDLLIGSGAFYAGAPEPPYVPGVEGVGRVEAGERLRAGQRVRFQLMPPYVRDGCLSEWVVVREDEVFGLGAQCDDATAAGIGLAGMAAWLALEWRAELAAGERVLVLGASGAVGQLGVQIAHELGAGRVVAAARSTEGLERARVLGADATVVLGELDGQELITAFTEAADGPVDVVLDPLWGPPALAALGATAPGGRLVNLGQSADAEASVSSSRVRSANRSVLGLTVNLVPAALREAAFRRLIDAAARGVLRLETRTLPLDAIAEAWSLQAASPHRKLVLLP